MSKEDIRRRPLMEIHVAGLGDGEHPFAFEVPAAEIGLDDFFVGNVSVSGVLRKVSRQITLTATVHAGYHKECDRCLAEISREVDIPMELFYREVLPAERSRGDDGGNDDIMPVDPDHETIVLDEDVRQTILLDVPLKMLCQDKCRGICPRCGANLNHEECRCEAPEIDPRWEKLSGLFGRADG